MNAVSSLAPASSAEAAFELAVVRGVALIGVVAGFTRRVFGLGRAAAQLVVRLEKQGADPYATDMGFDVKSAVGLLQRALHLADALRARLRTPPVVAALLRPWAAARHARIARPAPAAAADKDAGMPLQLWQISYLRAHEETRAAYREAIAGMSDREVVAQIHDHLMGASAMLGQNGEAAGVAALGQKAARLLAAVAADVAPAADDAVPDEVVLDCGAPRCGVPVLAAAGSDSAVAPPAPPAVGRGPPL